MTLMQVIAGSVNARFRIKPEQLTGPGLIPARMRAPLVYSKRKCVSLVCRMKSCAVAYL